MSPMPAVRTVHFAACLCLLLPSAGCNEPRAEVSGKITVQGREPNFKGMEIAFLKAGGGTVKAPVAEDGTYRVTGLSTGIVQVGILYTPLDGLKEQCHLPKPGVDPMAKGKVYNPIPEPLRDPSTSKLTYAVMPG